MNELAKKQGESADSIFQSILATLPASYADLDPETLRQHLERKITGTRMINAGARRPYPLAEALVRNGQLTEVARLVNTK